MALTLIWGENMQVQVQASSGFGLPLRRTCTPTVGSSLSGFLVGRKVASLATLVWWGGGRAGEWQSGGVVEGSGLGAS